MTPTQNTVYDRETWTLNKDRVDNQGSNTLSKTVTSTNEAGRMQTNTRT